MIKKVHVKTGDTVIVVSGNDKGKKGKVLEVSPKEGKVIVQGVHMVKKHVKPRPPKDQETPIYACKVMVVCPKCSKGVRIAHKIENGKKTRVCAKCGAEL